MERVNCESKEELMEKHNIRLYGPRVQAEWVLSLSSCSLSSSPPSSFSTKSDFTVLGFKQRKYYWPCTHRTTTSCRILIKQSGGEKSLDTLDVVNLWKKKSLRGKRETWRAQSTYVQNEEQRHQVQFQITFAHSVLVCKIFVQVLNENQRHWVHLQYTTK